MSNKPGADRGQEGGVSAKDMLEAGGGQRLEGDKTQSAGAYLEIRTELRCSV